MTYDVFICHASEDKASFVKELAEELRERNVSVWYDEFSLNLGDSLVKSIDKGIADSAYGIVVLSPSFFAKQCCLVTTIPISRGTMRTTIYLATAAIM